MNDLLVIIFAKTALAICFASSASVDYTANFSQSDLVPFIDGRLNGQDTWVAHPNYSISDSIGTGLLNEVNANGPVHTGTSADITSELAEGKTIILTLEFNFEGTFSNQNNGAWLLGLCDDESGMPEGASATIGSAIFRNNENGNFWLSPVSFPNGSKSETSVVWDAEFHTLKTTITKSEIEDEFDITTELDGEAISYVMTHQGLWSGADAAYAGFRFRGNQSGNIESFRIISTNEGGGGVSDDDDEIKVESASYEAGTGVTFVYTSTTAVDIYRNATGDLSAVNFSLIASGEIGGTYVDETADPTTFPKAFYVLVPEGDLPVLP